MESQKTLGNVLDILLNHNNLPSSEIQWDNVWKVFYS